MYFVFLVLVFGLIYLLSPLIFSPAKELKLPPVCDEDQLCDYKDQKQNWTDQKDQGRAILQANEGFACMDNKKGGWNPQTVVQVFSRAVKLHGDTAAMRIERPTPPAVHKKAPPSAPLDQWKTWTWKQYNEDVMLAARAFIELGLETRDAVNIFGFNSPEWFMAEIAAIHAGGLAAGIYPSDTAEQIKYKCLHSGASIAVCEDMKKVARFEAGIEELPKLKAIIVWAEEPEMKSIKRKDGSTCRVLTWEQLLEIGKDLENDALEARIAELKPNMPCALIYTSGTTGNPKAVMISHDNILWEAHAVMSLCGMIAEKKEEERLISYLPLSHVAGMMVDIICPIFVTADSRRPGHLCVHFARPYDLKIASIVERFKAVRPTLFLGVPRVWEKIAEKLQAIGKKTKGLLKTISTNAKRLGLEHASNCQLNGTGAKPMMYGLVEKFVLNKIKQKLGLDKMKFGFTGAAPITKETLSYFGSLGIQINEVYGMSECCGATTWSLDETHVWGSCGFPIPGTEVKILSKGDGKVVPRAKDIFNPSEEEQGEICFRGRHIMVGYMSNPVLGKKHVAEIKKKNKSAIDDQGWLHSGDKGCMGPNGMVKITGRFKELIIGAGGENVAPVPIESNVKRLCPAISNIMMVGDKKKFNIALVTLKADGATGEKPGTDNLTGPALEVIDGVTTISAACKDKKYIDTIIAAIVETNKDGTCCPSNAAKIQRISILPRDFSVETGDLTPTLKLKRSKVQEKHADLIAKIYAAKRGATYVPYEE